MEGSLYQFISAIRIPQPECIEKLKNKRVKIFQIFSLEDSVRGHLTQ